MTYLQKIIFGIFLFFSCVLIAQQHGVEGGNITWEFKQENNVGYIRFYLKVDNEDGSYGDMSGLQPVLTNLRTRVRGSGYNVTQDGSFGEKTFYFYPVQKQYLDIMANEADPNFILKKESIYRRAERGSADLNSFKDKVPTDVNTNPMGWDKEGVRNVLKGPDGYKIPPQLKTSYYQTLWLEVDPRQWDYASYIDVAVTMRTRGLDRLPLPPTEDHPYGSFYRYRSPGERFTSSFIDELWRFRGRNYKTEHNLSDPPVFRARIYPHYDKNGNQIPFDKTQDKSAVPFNMGYQGVLQNGQGSLIASAYDEDGDLLVYRWDDPIDIANHENGGNWSTNSFFNNYFWNNSKNGIIKWRSWNRTYGMQPTLDVNDENGDGTPQDYENETYTIKGKSYNDFYQYRNNKLFNHEIYFTRNADFYISQGELSEVVTERDYPIRYLLPQASKPEYVVNYNESSDILSIGGPTGTGNWGVVDGVGKIGVRSPWRYDRIYWADRDPYVNENGTVSSGTASSTTGYDLPASIGFSSTSPLYPEQDQESYLNPFTGVVSFTHKSSLPTGIMDFEQGVSDQDLWGNEEFYGNGKYANAYNHDNNAGFRSSSIAIDQYRDGRLIGTVFTETYYEIIPTIQRATNSNKVLQEKTPTNLNPSISINYDSSTIVEQTEFSLPSSVDLSNILRRIRPQLDPTIESIPYGAGAAINNNGEVLKYNTNIVQGSTVSLTLNVTDPNPSDEVSLTVYPTDPRITSTITNTIQLTETSTGNYDFSWTAPETLFDDLYSNSTTLSKTVRFIFHAKDNYGVTPDFYGNDYGLDRFGKSTDLNNSNLKSKHIPGLDLNTLSGNDVEAFDVVVWKNPKIEITASNSSGSLATAQTTNDGTVSVTFTITDVPDPSEISITNTLSADDILVSSTATLTNFTVTSDPYVYTATLSPTQDASLAPVSTTVTVTAGSWGYSRAITGQTFEFSNINTDTYEWTSLRANPTITITPAKAILKSEETIRIDFETSLPTTDFTIEDIINSNPGIGTFANFATVSSTSYQVDYTPYQFGSDQAPTGIVSNSLIFNVNSNLFSESIVGNLNTESNTNLNIDTRVPTATISLTFQNGFNLSTQQATGTISINFSEDVQFNSASISTTLNSFIGYLN